MNRPLLLPSALLLGLLGAGCALAGGRLAVQEDNDVFALHRNFGVDRDYTQGLAAALTLADADTPEWARAAARSVPLFATDARVHLGLVAGQEIYSPKNRDNPALIPDDRPYAGWLYAGVAIEGISLDGDADRRRDRMDALQLDLGTLGPASMAEPAQAVAHRLFGIDRPRGWDNQLPNEPGLNLTWETRWRLWRADLGSGVAVEVLPRVRARAGTIHDDAAAGVVGRVGWNLPRDFGPRLVDGTDLVRGAASPRPWIALSLGAEGRGVLRDAFLDGGLFRDGHSVDRIGFVHDTLASAEVGYGSLSLVYAMTWRSPQFRERRRYHEYATFLAAWTWRF